MHCFCGRQRLLNRLTGVPVDIAPRFATKR
jgi:hypothetical protein